MRILVPLSILSLAACTSPVKEAPSKVEPAPVEEAKEYSCAAESVQYAIGQKTSAELGSKLVTESGSRTLRWMPPRSAATMDYRQDRLNIAYDDDMVITRINCG
jgi:Peptidase inhibitor I78 family